MAQSIRARQFDEPGRFSAPKMTDVCSTTSILTGKESVIQWGTPLQCTACFPNPQNKKDGQESGRPNPFACPPPTPQTSCGVLRRNPSRGASQPASDGDSLCALRLMRRPARRGVTRDWRSEWSWRCHPPGGERMRSAAGRRAPTKHRGSVAVRERSSSGAFAEFGVGPRERTVKASTPHHPANRQSD